MAHFQLADKRLIKAKYIFQENNLVSIFT
uniref:Uncharacterized protein n=1 Tax=Tetranychus urticae TaxID=32264 RepID=T1K564_TETUR